MPRVLPEAGAETYEAALRYDRQQPGLGAEFPSAVDKVMQLIEATPHQYPIHEALAGNQRYRRVMTKRFPDVVIDDNRDDEILIVAVAHASRQPGNWLSRVYE